LRPATRPPIRLDGDDAESVYYELDNHMLLLYEEPQASRLFALYQAVRAIHDHRLEFSWPSSTSPPA
jgi:hypothetical protein